MTYTLIIFFKITDTGSSLKVSVWWGDFLLKFVHISRGLNNELEPIYNRVTNRHIDE